MDKANLDQLGALSATSLSSSPTIVRQPFWLWPNLLSLDAVFVAVIWQQLFAAAVLVNVRWQERLALGLAVWIVYVTDRLLDANSDCNLRSARHQFYRRHRALATGLILIAGGGEVFLVSNFDHSLLLRGLLLSVAVVLYLFCVHACGQLKNRIPKELAVGLVFSAGVGLIAFSRAGLHSNLVAAYILFAALCFLNCASIEYLEWQSLNAGERLPPRPSVRWTAKRLSPLLCGMMCFSFPLMLAKDSRELYGSIVIASLALIGFDKRHHSMSPDQMRVAADFPLLLPVLFLVARANGF